MTKLSAPWICLLVASPLFTALVIGSRRRPRSARLLAVAGAALTLVVGVWLSLSAAASPGGVLADPLTFGRLGAPRPLFVLDPVGVVAVPLLALVTLATLLAMPPTEPAATTARHVLTLEAAGLLLLVSADLVILGVAWTATALPLLWSVGLSGRRSVWRFVALYLLGGCLPLLLGLAWVVRQAQGAGLPAPTHLPDLVNVGGFEGGVAAFTLLLLAALVRGGLFPFQSWVPVLFEEACPGVTAVHIATHAGVALLARVALPLFPSIAAGHPLSLDEIGLLTAVYAAAAAVAPRCPRRVLAWLVVSQSAVMMIGLVCHNSLGVSGGLVQWYSLGIAFPGMVLGVWLAEARVGPGDMRRYTGVAQGAPALAGVFVLFAFASVGLPATAGFIGEDILVHGVLETFAWIGVGVVMVTALNGVTAFRLFAHQFLGARSGEPAARLRPNERLALAILAVAILLVGLVPGPLVASRAGIGRTLAGAREVVGHAGR